MQEKQQKKPRRPHQPARRDGTVFPCSTYRATCEEDCIVRGRHNDNFTVAVISLSATWCTAIGKRSR
jgi:hypothetical protein